MAKQTFNFIGELLMPRELERFYKNWSKKDERGRELARNSISFGIKENGNNTAFVSLMGFQMDEIRTYGVNGEQLSIDWKDRLDPDIAKNVSFSRKYRVNLTDDFNDGKEFITQYDMVEYLAENLPHYDGKLRVTGTWEKNAYNGKITDRFVIQNVYAATLDSSNKLELSMEAYYNGDCVKEQKSDGKVYLDCYIRQFVRGSGNIFFHQNAVLCNAAYDMNNERHVALWNLKKSYLENLSKKKMYRMVWECRYINGAEVVEFDESMLTAPQKEAIELGMATLDDYKPRGPINGPKVNEVRLAAPKLTGDYKDGLVECDEKVDEILSMIFSFESTKESLDEIVAKEEQPTKISAEELLNSDEDDLF